jgi:hypothetical protein
MRIFGTRKFHIFVIVPGAGMVLSRLRLSADFCRALKILYGISYSPANILHGLDKKIK